MLKNICKFLFLKVQGFNEIFLKEQICEKATILITDNQLYFNSRMIAVYLHFDYHIYNC